ncbi:MAG: fatty acid desaturase family protein [Myxococcota bacterium]
MIAAREDVGMLKYRADIRTWIVITSYFALVAGAWLTSPGVDDAGALRAWTAYLWVPLIAQVSFVCAVITHNTIHCPMFTSRWLNKWTQVVLTLTYGHPVSSFVPGHNLAHHHAPQSARDVMRTTKLRFRWNLLNQLLHPAVVSRAIMAGEIAYAKAMRTQRPRWFRQLMLESLVYVACVVGLLVLDWQKFLLFIFIPHQFAAWGIIGINFLQHDGCDENHPFNHSRNFVGRWTNWWTFNNGYHGIHHMHPSMHWSLLPEAHQRELAPYIHPNLDQPSLLHYAFQACIWPGHRLRYDGTPVKLPPPVPDESWVPSRADPSVQAALGAEEDDALAA